MCKQSLRQIRGKSISSRGKGLSTGPELEDSLCRDTIHSLGFPGLKWVMGEIKLQRWVDTRSCRTLEVRLSLQKFKKKKERERSRSWSSLSWRKFQIPRKCLAWRQKIWEEGKNVIRPTG